MNEAEHSYVLREKIEKVKISRDCLLAQGRFSHFSDAPLFPRNQTEELNLQSAISEAEFPFLEEGSDIELDFTGDVKELFAEASDYFHLTQNTKSQSLTTDDDKQLDKFINQPIKCSPKIIENVLLSIDPFIHKTELRITSTDNSFSHFLSNKRKHSHDDMFTIFETRFVDGKAVQQIPLKKTVPEKIFKDLTLPTVELSNLEFNKDPQNNLSSGAAIYLDAINEAVRVSMIFREFQSIKNSPKSKLNELKSNENSPMENDLASTESTKNSIGRLSVEYNADEKYSSISTYISAESIIENFVLKSEPRLEKDDFSQEPKTYKEYSSETLAIHARDAIKEAILMANILKKNQSTEANIQLNSVSERIRNNSAVLFQKPQICVHYTESLPYYHLPAHTSKNKSGIEKLTENNLNTVMTVNF